MRLKDKVALITGASSGIGKATARLFLDKGWNVVATMRNPAAEKDLKASTRLKIVALDVQDPDGARSAVAEAIKTFGRRRNSSPRSSTTRRSIRATACAIPPAPCAPVHSAAARPGRRP